MKNAFLLLFSITMNVAISATLDDHFSSNELKHVCQTTLKTNGNFYRTFNPRFSFDEGVLFYSIVTGNNDYSVFSTDNKSSRVLHYKSSEKIIDIEINGNDLWIAHKGYINHLDLLTNKYSSKIKLLSGDFPIGKHDRIHDIHSMNGVLYIAHGVHGVFALDEASKKIKWNELYNVHQNNGHRSKFINIVGENGFLYAGMDNLTMPTNRSKPFNGFIKIDINNHTKFQQSPYNRRRAGIMAYAHTTIANDVIYVNNLGHLQYIKIRDIKPKKKITPKWYPNWYKDAGIRRTAMWKGNVLIDNQTAYGCAHFHYTQNNNQPDKVALPLITKF